MLKTIWEWIAWVWARRLVLMSLLPLIAAGLIALGIKSVFHGVGAAATQIWDAGEWMIPVGLMLAAVATVCWLLDSRRIRHRIEAQEEWHERAHAEDARLGNDAMSVTPHVAVDRDDNVRVVLRLRNQSGYELVLQGVTIDHIGVANPTDSCRGIPLWAEERVLPATHAEPDMLDVIFTLPRDLSMGAETFLRISGAITRNRVTWSRFYYALNEIAVVREPRR